MEHYVEIHGQWHYVPPLSSSAFSLDSCHQVPSELSYLVAEIRALRGQLEQSIQGNNCLRRQLEQQLDCGAGKANLNPSSVGQNFSASVEPASTQPLFQGREEEGSRALPLPVEMSMAQATVLLNCSARSGRDWRCFDMASWVTTWDSGSGLSPDSKFATYKLSALGKVFKLSNV